MSKKFKVAIFVGSLRKASFTRKIANALIELTCKLDELDEPAKLPRIA